jgi:NAD(P)H-quinone oxidoreductase subunit 5
MLAIAITQLYGQGVSGRLDGGVLVRTASIAAAVSLAFYALEIGTTWVLGDAVPVAIATDALTVGLMSGVVLVFAVVTSVQLLLPGITKSPRLAPLYVHVRNGFYANARLDRLVGALRAPLTRP